ncbi:MAG: class I SAM-dependent methyltransferase [Thermodesulfobacteriota bacterium]|nr:class I SAM-dependent methyltransferase [Thermodesulfobacteriota bacterium]
MIPSRFVRQSLLILCLFMLMFTACVFVQAATNKEYEPVEGQGGKDVIWVPTSLVLVNKMLDMAKVTPQDYVIDLGSGDGRTVITAAKRGARALGIEYNPDMVALSKRNAVREGITDKAQFVQGDIFESDFSQATVIAMFLLEDLNIRLRPQILDLKPGTRVVSNTFTMGEWTADEIVTAEKKEGCESYCTAYLWIVPAKVEGTWMLPQGELRLNQSFQMISGTLKSGTNTAPVMNGKLNGDQISFSVGNAKYTGRVSGSTMQGTFESGGNTTKWNATKASKVL